jgi:hypothetical protein
MLNDRQSTTAFPAMGSFRRDFLRVGSLLPFGLLAGAGPLQAAIPATAARAKACILLWLDGGPSHLETFDPKEDVPEEVRGPWGSIASAVPGIRLSELLPLTARIADRIAILRSLTSPLGEHGIANQYLLTGYPPSPAIDYPSLGALVARHRPGVAEIPPYVVVPEARTSMGAGYLGPRHAPFSAGGDPARPDYRVSNLDFYPGLDRHRLDRRRRFLEQVQQLHESSDQSGTPLDPGFEQALQLLGSDQTRHAFNLSAEPDTLRELYGSRTFGQSCLLARRLVEHGVPMVTVVQTGWDTHDRLQLHLRDGYSGAQIGVGLVPIFDSAFAALILDLEQRGLLDETLVVAMGEFGRTPKINTRGGRDHWPRVFSVVLAGGGIRGGQVIGASDRIGESPRDLPLTPADLARAILQQLGIAPDTELHTPDGRPMRINASDRDIPGLV